MTHKALFSALLLALVSVALAADSQLQQIADQLSKESQQLSDEAYDGFRRRDRGNRADVEALYATIQFRSTTELFRRMVEDDRPESELRDSILILRDRLNLMDRYAFGRQARTRMSGLLQDIERRLGGQSIRRRTPSTPSGEDEYDWRRSTPNVRGGMLTWSGRVDDEVILALRGSRVGVRVVEGARVQNEDYTFESPLPRRELDLEVRKIRGRGSVDVIEEPSRENDYTGLIRIRDNRSGSDIYELEVTWER